MLLDTIGIIVGFLTVVLLLSILVTAIVQTAANLMRRRHKALALGVTESNIVQTIEYLREQIDKEDANAAKLFDHVVATISSARTDPRVTWLEDKDVITPLIEAKVPDSGVAVARHVLDHTRRVMEDKYLQWTRGLTVAASIVVALWFGASAPELLQRLRTDTQFRARAEALGEQLVRETPAEYQSIIEGRSGCGRAPVSWRRIPNTPCSSAPCGSKHWPSTISSRISKRRWIPNPGATNSRRSSAFS